MTKTIITLSALCYALQQAYTSHINIFCNYCNDTDTDRLMTLKALATEIAFTIEESGMSSAEVSSNVLWYDAELLAHILTVKA